MNDRRSGQGSSILTRGRLKASELFPLMSSRRGPLSSAFVAPALLTLFVVVLIAVNSLKTYVDLRNLITIAYGRALARPSDADLARRLIDRLP